jgi:hypothetical protein
LVQTDEERKAKEKTTRDRPENRAREKARRQTDEYKKKGKEFRDRPENKAKEKARNQRPEVKASKKKYNKDYHSRDENKKRRKERDSTPEAKARKKELHSTDKSKAKDAERYQKNKEKMDAQSRKWNKDNRELVNQRARKHRADNLEDARKYAREWHRNNPIKSKASGKKYYHSHKAERKANSIQWIKNNREHYLKQQVQYNKENSEKKYKIRFANRMVVLSYYSLESYPICTGCGEKEIGFLEIDHVKGVIEKDGRGGNALVKYIIDNNFPENYQVLCTNCNWLKYRESQKSTLSQTKENIRSRAKVLKLKTEVFSHYSKGLPKCNCCGIDTLAVLSLDHIHGRKNAKHKKDLGGHELYTWVRQQEYPTIFQVLCMMCNFAKGMESNNNKCPHEMK